MAARGRSITASAVIEVGGWTTAAEENVVDQFLAAWLLRE
ncbi:MAG: hypothetical protein QOG33_2015 [Gaiellales bacterium]|nr:hypothetical protein [Gaiellales bacterium]